MSAIRAAQTWLRVVGKQVILYCQEAVFYKMNFNLCIPCFRKCICLSLFEMGFVTY